MKKIIIAWGIVISVTIAFTGCGAASHASHGRSGNDSSSQHSGGCH